MDDAGDKLLGAMCIAFNVDAPPVSSRKRAYGTGTKWIANPSLYRAFTNYAPPAFDGAFQDPTRSPPD